MAKCRDSPLHTVVIRPVEKRDFANWSMGFLERMEEPVDLQNVLSRRDDWVAVWNHADWPFIVNTIRAELETLEP
jgi:hypothetical protein